MMKITMTNKSSCEDCTCKCCDHNDGISGYSQWAENIGWLCAVIVICATVVIVKLYGH